MGVRYVDGLERFLDPDHCAEDGEYAELGAARFYHVRSDSVFDFKPRAESRGGERKFRASEIEDVLDLVVQGSGRGPREVEELLREGGFGAIHALARKIDASDKPRTARKMYVAVVGVYTDIKVQTLLVGMRTRYDLPNLAVSDTFTASQTLERHLSGLDYAAKVLDVEVVHGINDLVGFLGLPAALEDEETWWHGRASRATAPSSRTSRTCSPSRTRSCVSTSRSPSAGRWTSTSGSSARTLPDRLRLHVLVLTLVLSV